MSSIDNGLNWIVMVLLALAVWGCDEADDDLQQRMDQMVLIEGYMYANEPVQQLRISKIQGGGSAHTLPLVDAAAWITQGDNTFELIASDSSPGTYVQVDTTQLIQGHGNLKLMVQYGGKSYSAHTTVPPAVTGLNIDNDIIHMSTAAESEVIAHLSWDPQGNGPYCIFIRNRQQNVVETGYVATNEADNPFISLVYTHQAALQAGHFTHLGTYDLYVTLANPEYVDLYTASLSGGFVSAPSNILNAHGIFTAFNGASVTVHVQ